MVNQVASPPGVAELRGLSLPKSTKQQIPVLGSHSQMALFNCMSPLTCNQSEQIPVLRSPMIYCQKPNFPNHGTFCILHGTFAVEREKNPGTLPCDFQAQIAPFILRLENWPIMQNKLMFMCSYCMPQLYLTHVIMCNLEVLKQTDWPLL